MSLIAENFKEHPVSYLVLFAAIVLGGFLVCSKVSEHFSGFLVLAAIFGLAGAVLFALGGGRGGKIVWAILIGAVFGVVAAAVTVTFFSLLADGCNSNRPIVVRPL